MFGLRVAATGGDCEGRGTCWENNKGRAKLVLSL